MPLKVNDLTVLKMRVLENGLYLSLCFIYLYLWLCFSQC